MDNSEAKILSGIAGEYFVAGELSRRGYLASITLRNTAHIDILASNGEKTVNIQVKTKCRERADNWNLGSKPLEYKNIKNNFFYVLVDISSSQDNKEIEYYIISKNQLNEQVEKGHLLWQSGKKSNGEPRKSETRIFKIESHPELNIEKCKNNWNQLFA